MATTTEDDQSFITNQSIFTKYQTAADICNRKYYIIYIIKIINKSLKYKFI